MDDDEETWLTPQLSAQPIDNQSKPIDLKEWFNQIPTSDRASTLSRKLQKYAQKRAKFTLCFSGKVDSSNHTARERLRFGSSLDCVEEVSVERSITSQTSTACPDTYGTSASSCSSPATANCTMNTPNYYYHPESESFGASINVTGDNECSDHSPAEIHPSLSLIGAKCCFLNESTVSCSSAGFFSSSIPPSSLTSSSHSPLFTSTPELVLRQLNISESDDEFFDASSDLPGDLECVSYGMRDGTGISVVRNRAMTQSLAEVEEELPIGRLLVQTNVPRTAKHIRSNSVSPRPMHFQNSCVDQVISSNSPIGNEQITNIKNSAEEINLIRSHPQLTTTPLSTREGTVIGTRRNLGNSHNLIDDNRSRGIRRSHLRTQITNSQSSSTPRKTLSTVVGTVQDPKPSSALRPSPLSHGDLNPDLKTVQDLARQQEEALRQAVMQQQQLERKHSWQSDGIKQLSTHSSAASLVSSKSADISTLHKPHALSKIPGPSKCARKTGIPLPSKKIAAFVTREYHPHSACNDECF